MVIHCDIYANVYWVSKSKCYTAEKIILKLKMNSFCFFLAELLKCRWKNLRDGMMRCLKKIKDGQKLGGSAFKMPTCKLFDQLLFLKDFVSNRETNSHISITSDSGSNDSITVIDDSAHLTPPSTTPDITTPKVGPKKRKAETDGLEEISSHQPSRRLNKKSERQDKIDLLLVNALSKSDESMAHSESKSSNHLFCDSIVEILDKLPSKKNRMARVEIQQVLLKYEFDNGDDKSFGDSV